MGSGQSATTSSSRYLPIRAAITSFHQLPEVAAIQPGTLLLLDIDATLFHKNYTINIDQAPVALTSRFENILFKIERAFGEDAGTAMTGLSLPGLHLTEADLPAYLQSLSEQGVYLVPFTSRPITNQVATAEDLATLGFNFSQWNTSGMNLPDFFLEGVKVNNNIIYNVGRGNAAGFKSKALAALINYLTQQGLSPTSLVMVDDTMVHLDQMAALIQDSTIPLYLVNYQGGKNFQTMEQVATFMRSVVEGFDEPRQILGTETKKSYADFFK